MNNLKKLITINLIANLIYMFIPVSSFAVNIENIADISYKNNQNREFTTTSNKVGTNSLSGFNLDLIPSFNSVDGQSKGSWNFPVSVSNIGNGSDKYNLTLSNLPEGVIGQIYSDSNGNGIIDPEDKLVTETSLVNSGNTFPIIVSLTDTKGLPVGSKVDFNVIATSQTINGLSSTKPLSVNIIPAPDYSVNLVPKINSIQGQSKGIWDFPVTVNNIGKNDDAYKLTLSNLPNGIDAEIYIDINGNGLVDSADVLMTSTLCSGASSKCYLETITDIIYSNKNLPIIVRLKDTIGFTPGSEINFTLTATSRSNSSVSSTKPLSVRVVSQDNGGYIPDNPTPTATPSSGTNNNTVTNFNANLKKTVFPAGLAKAGDILTYYIEFTNNNGFVARDVIISDKLPKGLTVITGKGLEPVTTNDGKISFSSDGGNYSETPNNAKFLRFSWSSVQQSETVTAYFKAKIDDVIENGSLENIATANYKAGENDNNSNTLKTTNVMSNMAVNTVKNEYSIAGTVYDKKTGLPKEGVIVIVYDKDGKEVGKDITGKTGKYRVPVDSKGEYKVVYTDASGNPISQNLTTVDKPGENPAPIEIRGKVLDSQTKTVIANAELKLIDANKKVIITLKTDEEGNFIFDRDTEGKNLQAGKYIIRVVNAKGQVSYARVNVTVSAGDMVVNLEVLIDPFGTVYDEYGGIDVRIKDAQVKLLYNCDDPNSFVKLDDIDGMLQKNPFTTDDKGIYQYFLNGEQLNNKNYCLDVSAEGYKGKKFFLRTAPSKETPNRYVLEITDIQNPSKKELIKNIETIPYNVPLTPTKTFDLNKASNKSSIEIGEVVTYTIDVKNKLKFRVDDAKITDQLPFGFKYVPNTLKVNGNFVKDFNAIDKLIVSLGDMNPEQKAIVMYQARTAIRTSEGPSVNTAFVEALSPKKDKIKSDIVKATVFVRKGVFSKNGAIIGKVYLDTNNNGIQDINEQGIPNITIYTSNGLRIITDTKGKYSIPDVQDGDFAVIIDSDSLPKGYKLAKDKKWIGQNDTSQRLFVPESGLTKFSFGLVKDEEPIKEIVKENSLKAVFTYPNKFSIKKIPYITYPDIKDHWVRDIVEYESGLEIIHGYPDGLFKPARSISRAEATKLTLVALKSFDIKIGTSLSYILKTDAKVNVNLTDSNGRVVKSFYSDTEKKAGIHSIYWNGKDDKNNLVPVGKYNFNVSAENKDKISNSLSTSVEAIPAIPNYKPEGKADFKDVPDTHWATNFIKVGAEEKLVNGYPDNTFRPDNFIPRFEMSVIAVKALNLSMDLAKDELPFEDANDVPSWAKKYVYLAYTNGLLPKFPDNKFYSSRNITRAEIAQFVNALINKQKIDAQVSGVVESNEKELNVEGIVLDLSKEKEFSKNINKDYSENVDIKIPSLKLEAILDEKYKSKEIKR